MPNLTPILVTGTLTPGGTQDVNIVSQAITLAISAASLPLPTGAATEATLAAIKAQTDKLTFTSTRLLVDGSGVVQPVSGPLTDTQLRATPVPISGTVSLTTESIEIGTVDQGTGGASAWKVDGSAVIQPVSGTVAVSNFPVSQSVTQGTSPWVISGTVAATQSGAWTTGRTWTLSSGTDSVAAVQSGTWNINNISGTISLPTGAATETTLSALNSKVTVVNTGAVTISTALPAGTNVIGHVITDSGSTTTVSNFPATQPVSGTVTANQGTPNSAANKWPIEIVDSGGVNIAAVTAANALKVDGSAVTQPISAASLPLPTGAATETTLAGIKTDTDKFTFTSTRLLVDGSGVTQPVSGTVAVTQSTSPWVISGTVTANAGTNLNTSLLLLDSTFTTRINTLGQKTSANSTPVVIASDQSAVPVSGTVAVTQSTSPWVISGTVTANAGTNLNTSALALDATLTNATQKTKIVDTGGTNVASVDATGDVQVDVNNGSGAAAVNIQDGGNSITVDGTVAATQSGTWTVQPGNTPNTSPWLVEQRTSTISTYSASIQGLASALLATDVFTITGSGTKTVKVTRIEFSGTETTSAVRDVLVIKRSTANSAGTSTTPAVVPHDSNNSAGTAVVRAYTANPTLGSTVGTIRVRKIDIEATNLVGASDFIQWEFGETSQAVVLRGTSEVLAINLNGVTSAGSSLDISITWTEE